MKKKLPVILAFGFTSSLLTTSLPSIPAFAQSAQYDIRSLQPDFYQSLPQRYSSGASGQQWGYRTNRTQKGATANRRLHVYRNTTKSQSPGGNGFFTAIQPARYAGLAGVFGYDDGGLGGDRVTGWTTPYTPSPIVAPPYADYQQSQQVSGEPVYGSEDAGGSELQTLHDGTPYDGQMMLSDCGGYIGYVPNDFHGSMEDWWRSPYCAYQITPNSPSNVHYRSWQAQGSPSLF